MKKFKIIKNSFGYKDEQATQDAFVEFVGGRHKAERLSYLWSNSYPGISANIWKKPTKEDSFRRVAKNNGFTEAEIEAFLML